MPPERNQAQANPLGTAPIGRLLPKFAIPAIISFLVTSLYNIVDQIFIGQGVGYLGNAATTVSFPFTTISTALALLMGIGTAANFNLNLGAQNQDKAREAAGSGLSCLALLSLSLGAVALLFRRPLLLLFGATPDVLPYALTYTRITAFGLPMVTFTTGGSNLIRADGAPAYSMLCTLSGAVLNTILDYIFIFPLNMGVAGGALATVLGQALSLLMTLGYFLRTRLRMVHLTPSDLRPRRQVLQSICSLGMAAFFNQLAMLLVQIVLNNTLTHYGALSSYGRDIPLACAGVVSKVGMLVLGCVIGIAQGCQPIFSFNYGARKYGRVKEAYRKAVIAGTIICTVAFICFQTFPRQIVSIFGTGTEEYFAFAERFFRVYMFMTFANAFQPISANFFTSIGKARRGILISLTRQVIFLVPLLLIFPLFWGIEGALYASPISDAAAVAVALSITLLEMKRMPQDGELPQTAPAGGPDI